ncbi:hypothetical protein E3A20_17000, partial [Planctomyces bekefii]
GTSQDLGEDANQRFADLYILRQKPTRSKVVKTTRMSSEQPL